ncbi:PREDICTED: alkane hydroxylase MAH1-like [Erythranthe guttata]|uniref:alkane hydroxylase MAH1-like n=1 Tax=Erythranthe guttata TaxID=4155 RepID=UPI00064DC16B|nr:PREDICTED: alkane hydroxylase MAH1-like [Erythranthe guttata]|eukprot:XP_012841601.1 PREDICTED: alkane hydroxylase MAH1-like [Erythranthe guttata]
MEEDNDYYTANNKVNVFTVFKKVYEDNCGSDSVSTTLTWFFWLLAENGFAETKILEEIENVLSLSSHENPMFFGVEECKKLVYIHACLSETLRLFPPVALELKSPVEPNILPAGGNNNNNNIKVEKNTKIIISFYSTGRMESVWGKDCLEFKPERWILAGGELRHEPSFRFPAFNVGPRSCPGKEMSFVEMKMVAVAIVHRYRVRLVEGHRVSTRGSVILKY